MKIIAKLKKYFNTDLVLVNDDEYFELVDELGTSLESQNEFISYILSNELNIENKYRIFTLLSEVYAFELVENYKLTRLYELYKWILKLMFEKEFYEYSMCYRFSDLLVKMSKNVEQVYKDIIESINIYSPISVQIAICSMYGYYKFYEHKELTEKFLNKILMAIENNEDNRGIIKDFNKFYKNIFKLKEYSQYREKFKQYLIEPQMNR